MDISAKQSPRQHQAPQDASPSPVARRGGSFATRLVAWQHRHGRHDLPWQDPRDAYRVWLSEVMLQQTQVATVIPYFERFLAAFPSLQALAAASTEQVMAQWSGLGYYRRARLLHQCAIAVVEQHGGSFPVERDALVALPGIGRTTAAAIRVFAHGQRDAILDGNVKRVFCRHFAIEGVPDASPTQRILWPLAERELARRDVVAYTQGLMDLGATVCTRSKPACEQCPVADTCQALAQGRINELPSRRTRVVLPWREQTVLVLRDACDRVLLVARPAHGIWGGLLSLPEASLPPASSAAQLLRDAGLHGLGLRRGAARKQPAQVLEPIEHAFTHFRLRLHPVLVMIDDDFVATGVADSGGASVRQLALADVGQAPLPAPIKTLLQALQRGCGGAGRVGATAPLRSRPGGAGSR